MAHTLKYYSIYLIIYIIIFMVQKNIAKFPKLRIGGTNKLFEKNTLH